MWMGTSGVEFLTGKIDCLHEDYQLSIWFQQLKIPTVSQQNLAQCSLESESCSLLHLTKGLR